MKSVAILLVLIAFAAAQTNPAAVVVARLNALENLKTALLPWITSQLKHITVPTESVSGIRFSQVQVQEFRIPVDKTNIVLSAGAITVVCTHIAIDVYANAADSTWLGTITDDFTVQAIQSIFNMTLGLKYTNQLVFSVPNIIVEVNDLSWDFSGFLGSLADWILDAFSGNLESALDKQTQSSLATATVQALNQLAQNSSTQLPINGAPIVVSYTPIQDPTITEEFLSFALDGTIYPNSSGYQRPPFNSTITLPTIDETDPNDIQMFFSEYLLNSALWALSTEDYFEISITDGDLPSDCPFNMTTTSLNLLFPGLVNEFGAGNPVRFVCELYNSSVPLAQIQPNNISAYAPGQCEVWANNGSWSLVLTFAGEIYMGMDASITTNTTIKLTALGADVSNLNITQNNLPSLNAEFLALKLNVILASSLYVINKQLEAKTLPLPQIPNANITDPQIYIMDGYVEVTLNPVFYPPPSSWKKIDYDPTDYDEETSAMI